MHFCVLPHLIFSSGLFCNSELIETTTFSGIVDQILEERYHVRDVYTQRKGFPSPLLLLEFLDQEFAFNKRQAQVYQ